MTTSSAPRLLLGLCASVLNLACADPSSEGSDDEPGGSDDASTEAPDDEAAQTSESVGDSESEVGEESSSGETTDEDSGDDDSGDDDSGDDGGVKFDFEITDMGGGMPPSCEVPEGELDAVPECEQSAVAGSFEPDLQWAWTGEDLHVNAITTPLVANLTDDNEDGAVDLCDIPDIVVMTHEGVSNNPERLWVLDGATGEVHWDLDLGLTFSQTPAIGDVDDDGLPEIVAGTASNELVIISHDGLVQSQVAIAWLSSYRTSFGLADFDNDGDVEIYLGNALLSHEGEVIFRKSDEPLNYYHASVAADLDADGDLELVVGRSAFHHDGSVYYQHEDIEASHAQVGDLDGDGLPEVLLSGQAGLSLLEHDGSQTFVHQTPGGDLPVSNNWRRPAAIHDFDGDGFAELAVSSADHYNVIEGDFSLVWQAEVADLTGSAGGTAFDFLGDGSAEAIYGDESSLFIFDDLGQVLLEVPRLSRTTTEYPVVADVDNDGSAELVVVSESDLDPDGSPTVQVIRDVEDRWVPARRIWNQHAYHVTNVREDGTIPQHEPPHWEQLNTFRTQAQSEGGVCLPEPVG
ncbi:VCBS repeat-containing protein [Pseudenhygromyxa sp. WMMC2535]|uniref:FG-GAP repeat domain-containing protein n=1 Tax=Pseudenhygromyxa sp. WMMC2535 TaxID=2712867 RepID=UPI0015955B49|nr:VCBS repeat-containing protein [Pseudenhygromyxa sp. WMMC2535]NVB40546.1 VCBS repeat-containing protein [Pseudenhygromyxa sp. WMMC2535]